MDLLNPLADSELFWDTNYIDIGAPTFHGALVGGWNRDRKESGGTTFAKATSKNSYILFYVFEPSDRPLHVKCKGVSSDQKLFLSVNGKSLGSRKIDTVYQQYTFRVSGTLLRPGKNFLEIYSLLPDRSRASVIVDEISFFSDRGKSHLQTEFRRIFETSPDEPSTRSAIRAAIPSAIVEYVLVPKSSFLDVDYQLPHKMSSSVAAQIEVHIEDQQKRPRLLSSNILRNGLFSSHWRKESISLKDYENRIVELKFRAIPVDGVPSPEYIDWARISLKINSEDSEGLPTKKESNDFAVQKPSNIIIYVIDSLRQDHLQPYGYPHSTSPFISEFAKDSVLFRNAYSQSPYTRPSTASILTGLHPSSHGTGAHGLFPEDTPTAASELKSLGFNTYGFVTSFQTSNASGFGKDFDQYIYCAEEQPKEGVYLTSDKLYEHLNRSLQQGLRQPAFIYIHATDPQEPYQPGAEAAMIPPTCKEDLEDSTEKKCDSKLAECLAMLYDDEVRKSDYYFGQFLKRLKDLGMYEGSLIILTGDHGQSFCEHGSLQGKSLYQSEIRVPLIVKFPGKKFRGKEIQAPASHVDLLPTLFESVGAKIPDFLEGHSLFNLLNGDGSEMPVFVEFNEDNVRQKAFVFEKWKLIDTREKAENDASLELYDISKDPQESSDLSSRDPILFGYVRKMYRQFSRASFKSRSDTGRRESTFDRDTDEALKSVGYAQ